MAICTVGRLCIIQEISNYMQQIIDQLYQTLSYHSQPNDGPTIINHAYHPSAFAALLAAMLAAMLGRPAMKRHPAAGETQGTAPRVRPGKIWCQGGGGENVPWKPAKPRVLLGCDQGLAW